MRLISWWTSCGGATRERGGREREADQPTSVCAAAAHLLAPPHPLSRCLALSRCPSAGCWLALSACLGECLGERSSCMPLSMATRRGLLSIAPLYPLHRSSLSICPSVSQCCGDVFVYKCKFCGARGSGLSLEALSLRGSLTQRASLKLCLLRLDVDAERRED